MAGRWKGHRLRTLPGREVRPTGEKVREAWMASLHFELPGARVVDLFAGSGALGLEALSRGAREVVLVERSRRAVRVLERNVEALGAGAAARVVASDVFAYLEGLTLPPPPFDLALADPPYGRGLAARLVEHFLARPFASQLWVEHRSDEGVPEEAAHRRRRYGETVLTAYLDPWQAGEP